jgi:hypothetical protein
MAREFTSERHDGHGGIKADGFGAAELRQLRVAGLPPKNRTVSNIRSKMGTRATEGVRNGGNVSRERARKRVISTYVAESMAHLQE